MSKKADKKQLAKTVIRQQTFSRYVSSARLRRVQSLLLDEDSSSSRAVLCILGIDGKFSDGMREFANYLLFNLFDNRASRFDCDDDTAEDLVLVIGADRVDVYCNPVNYSYILPFIAHWRHLHIHCIGIDEQYEDVDGSEEFKITSFISMMHGCSTVGLPYFTSGSSSEVNFDPMVIEKWPLIQAFALEQFGGGGFFTMKHAVVDMSEEIHQLYTEVDPVFVETFITEHLMLFEKQWSSLAAVCDLQRRSADDRHDVLTESVVSEPLRSYFNHGNIGERRGEDKQYCSSDAHPFVLFGANTCGASLKKARKSPHLPSAVDNPQIAYHMICHAVAPKTQLKCTRTYFLHRDHQCDAGDGEIIRNVVQDVRTLVDAYTVCIEAAEEAVSIYTSSLDTSLAVDETRKVLLEQLKTVSPALASSNIEIILEQLISPIKRRDAALERGTYIPRVKYISVTVYDIPSVTDRSRNLGSVCYSDTFIDSAFTVKFQDGQTELDSTYSILTCGIPKHITWPFDNESRQKILQVEKNTTSLLSGETASLSSDNYFSMLKHGHLYISEDEFSFLHPMSSPVVIPVSQLLSIQFYDGGALNAIAFLILNYKPSFSSSIPSSLSHGQYHRICIILMPRTKAYRAMFTAVLPAFKKSASQVSSIDSLPTELLTLYKLVQTEMFMAEDATALNKAKCQLPNLDRFLSHCCISSVGWQPVSHYHCSMLHGDDFDPGSFSDEQQIKIFLLIGASKPDIVAIKTQAKSHGVGLVIVECPEDSSTDATPQLVHSLLDDAFTRVHTSEQMNILLSLPWMCDAVDIVQSILRRQFNQGFNHSVAVGSVTVYIDVNSFFMCHRYTLPHLLDNCANGWVNNIIIRQQGSVDAKASQVDQIRKLIRTANNEATVIVVDNKELYTDRTVGSILSDTSFNAADLIRARYLSTPGCYYGSFDTGNAYPALKKVVLRFSQPLDKSRLFSRLKGLKSGLSHFPFSRNVYCVSGVLDLIQSDSNSPVTSTLSYNTLSGLLSVTPTESNCSDIDSYVVFVGCDLEDKKLKDILRECLPQKRTKRVHRTRDSLTKTEINKVHRDHHLDVLPEGWFYNGSQYVSMDGEKTSIHPGLEQFLEDYLKKINEEIDRYNKTITNVTSRDLFP